MNVPPKPKSQSSLSIQFEYVSGNDNGPSCSKLCNLSLYISCLLFFIDIGLEFFLILQWIKNEYYFPVLILTIFIVLSNITNIIQWYSFSKDTTFTLCHSIILFGLFGLLPWICILYYLFHCYCCARICCLSHFNPQMQRKSSKSESLLPLSNKEFNANANAQNISHSNDNHNNKNNINKYEEMLSNVQHILLFQAFIRTLPSIIVEISVEILSTLDHKHWFLTYLNRTDLKQIHLSFHFNDKWKQIFLDNLSPFHFIAIAFALLTYSFITVTYLDSIKKWQVFYYKSYIKLFKSFQITCVICDCIIRIVPLILVLPLEIYPVFNYYGFLFLWCLETLFWNDIFSHFEEYPLRKKYPNLFKKRTELNAFKTCAFNNIAITSYISPSSLAALPSKSHNIDDMSDDTTNSNIDIKAMPEYVNPQYNDASSSVISPVSDVAELLLFQQSSQDSSAPFVPSKLKNQSLPLKQRSLLFFAPKLIELQNHAVCMGLDELRTLFQSVLGGTLGCFSGWLVIRSLIHCNNKRQYYLCLGELVVRYCYGCVFVVVFCWHFDHKLLNWKMEDIDYWIWLVILIVCFVLIIPYMIVADWFFRPSIRKIKAVAYHNMKAQKMMDDNDNINAY